MFEHLHVREEKVEKPRNSQKEQMSARKFTHFMKRDSKKCKEALEHFNDKMANLRSKQQIY